MKRVDIIAMHDDDNDEMLCGIVLFNGVLMRTEGSSRIAAMVLQENGPKIVNQLDRLHDLKVKYRGSALQATEVYDDDDDRYDEFGLYTGSPESGAPLPDDEPITFVEA